MVFVTELDRLQRSVRIGILGRGVGSAGLQRRPRRVEFPEIDLDGFTRGDPGLEFLSVAYIAGNESLARGRPARIRAQYPDRQSGECGHRRGDRNNAKERASSIHTRDRKPPRVTGRPRREQIETPKSWRRIVMIGGAARTRAPPLQSPTVRNAQAQCRARNRKLPHARRRRAVDTTEAQSSQGEESANRGHKTGSSRGLSSLSGFQNNTYSLMFSDIYVDSPIFDPSGPRGAGDTTSNCRWLNRKRKHASSDRRATHPDLPSKTCPERQRGPIP